jgi:hypothetical protein
MPDGGRERARLWIFHRAIHTWRDEVEFVFMRDEARNKLIAAHVFNTDPKSIAPHAFYIDRNVPLSLSICLFRLIFCP